MVRYICLAVLIVIVALPAYAGHGTIRETDEEIFIEYYGDEDDKQAAKVLKEEQQKEAVKEEKVVEIKNEKIKKNIERAAKHREDE
jgi:hypothetical protein